MMTKLARTSMSTNLGCWMIATFYLLIIHIDLARASTWSEWWTYDGISGPEFWGLVNPEWQMCSKGKMQSPINIDPSTLLYDPTIKHMHVDKHQTGGMLENTGHDIRVLLDDANPHVINMSGASLIYKYRVCEITIHFGSVDPIGSEHTIDGQAFPAEIQIMGYNTDLYGNFTQAQYSANGLAVIGILVQIGPNSNVQLSKFIQDIRRVRYKGQETKIHHVSVYELLPRTNDYLTYEGSLTQPGCHETVTWVILNKPIYISDEHMTLLREVMQGDEEHPKVPMANNYRPTRALYNRPIRTNINFQRPSKACTTEKRVYYQANVWDRS